MKKHTTSGEKHYQKLNKALREEKNRYYNHFQDERKLNMEYIKIINDQNEQIERLKLENEKLKSMFGLSDEQVKALLDAAIRTNELSNLAKIMFGTTFNAVLKEQNICKIFKPTQL
ncbi:MAG: hypothetical protein M0P99_00940 [Candidatus Cloacimonetes bacterium]|nr:hypothetical protein [Candidatus Cloacimonadota bacterium]